MRSSTHSRTLPLFFASLALAGCGGATPAADRPAPSLEAERAEAPPPAIPATAAPEASPPKEPEAPPRVDAESVPGPADFRPLPERVKEGLPPKSFAKVRAFAFDLEVNGPPVCRHPLREDGGPCKTVVWPGAELSAEQTGRLLKLLKSKSSYTKELANCFNPHHGFVFYDAHDVPVAYVSACFICENAIARPRIAEAQPYADYYGFTKATVGELRALCTELGLPKCDATDPGEFPSPQ